MDNTSTLSRDQVWLKRVTDAIMDHLGDENFGVAELSEAMATSRFQLHRKLKMLKGQSVSQFIRSLRLEEARKMLCADVATVSEIAYRVGFSSPSYFNKCFHDRYGYPPGEARKQRANQKNDDLQAPLPEFESVLVSDAGSKRRIRTVIKAAFFIIPVITCISLASFYFFFSDTRPEISIAILPLDNLTGSSDQAYIVDGIHDALIGELGKISAIRVISRTSTLRYPKSNMLLKDIARELDVNVIVEGSVYGSGDSVRLQLQLIDVFPDERHIWAKEYHEDIRKALSLHSAVVYDIAKEIRISLSPEEESRLRNTRMVNPDSYRTYLRGMFHLNQNTSGDVEKGIGYLLDAIKTDPGDPLPWAGLAIGYSTLGHGASAVDDAFVRAKSAAKKALALDSNLAEAHLALAMIALYNDWDWNGAEEGFTRALEINPNFAEAHTHYAWFQMLFGCEDKVFWHGKKATELEPFSSLYSAYLACELWWLGKHDEALLEVESALALAPENGFALYVKGGIYASKGIYSEAIKVHRKAAGVSSAWEWSLGHTFLLAAQPKETRKITDELTINPRPMDAWGLAEIYAAMEKKDEAFEWLEESYRMRFSWVPWIDWNPNYKPLKNDPRFHALLKRLNLPAIRQAITDR
jgi:TolB-like protein/AraC-like DNA-binding protein